MNEETLFHQALERPAAERAGFLAEACGSDVALRRRVEILLEAHDNPDSHLDPNSPAFAPTITQPAVAEAPGTVIGPYKLLEQIGEGGFGIVFMAEQLRPIRRKVALKVLKPGMDTRQVIARFEAERQALALMDHPHIARVYDGGATESGRPYFVMELVKGVPITEYCDAHQLTPRERLELFVSICQAVQHAHQKGIIHRDIKPSNVLVTKHDGIPVVKVIDFGVAKALGQQLTDKTVFTNFAQMIGTPLYMSPEQAELSGLDIDTRTDIYSLGVLLYELLTGTTPFDKERLKSAAFDEIRRIIREDEPPKPSTRLSDLSSRHPPGAVGPNSTRSVPTTSLASIAALRKTEPRKLSQLIRGDLDWIVMKALEKDRNRRYETANGFALDIQRYLADEPVAACPPSALYRFRKFARRNKAVLATGALVAASLVVAVVVLAFSNMMVSAERNAKDTALTEKGQALVEKQAALQQKGAALLQAEANFTEAKHQETLAQDARKEAVQRLSDAMAAVDLLARVAQERLASVPQTESVRQELLRDAMRYYKRFLENNHDDVAIRRETAKAFFRLARIQRWLAQYAEAESGYRKGFALFAELEQQSPLEPDARLELCQAHIEISACLRDLGKPAEQEEHMRQAIRIATGLLEEFPDVEMYRSKVAESNLYLAELLAPVQPGVAEEIFRIHLPAGTHPDLAVEGFYRALCRLLTTQGRTAEAEQAIRDGLAFCERFATEHPSDIWAQEELGLALYDLSNLVAARGQLEEAEAISGRAIKILDRVATDSPAGPYYRQNQAWGHQARAGILDRLNRGADAEQAYRRAMDLFAKLASDYPFHGFPQFASDSRLDLSRFLVRSGRTEDARDIWRKAIAAARKQADEVPDNPEYRVDLGRSLLRLADLLRSAAKHDEAEAALSEALIAFKELASRSPHPREDRYRRDAAGALRELGDQLRGAGRTADALAALRLAVDLYTGLPSAESQNNLAWLLATCPETALRDPRRGVELAAKAVELKPNQGMYWNTLGVAQYGAGDWKAAIKALTKSQELGNLSPAHDWFFLAMAEWQLGNQDAARGWYDKADQWLNENQKALEGTPDMAEELKRFRAEARDVLGIKDQ